MPTACHPPPAMGVLFLTDAVRTELIRAQGGAQG